MIRDAHSDDVRVLKHHFPPDTADVVWLHEIGRLGWVLVTEDKNIRRKPQERQALYLSKVTAFFLGKSFGELKLLDKGLALVSVWPKIQETAAICQQGSIFSVTVRGEVTALQHYHEFVQR
jgi:hypothetical protein